MRKGILILSLLTITLLIVSTLALGEDWLPITKSKDGNQSAFIDKESIKHTSRHAEKDIIKVLGKFVYKEPELFNSKYVGYSLSHYEFYCNEKSFRILQMLYHFTDDTKEPQFEPKSRQWTKIEPDTIEDVMYKHVCEKNK